MLYVESARIQYSFLLQASGAGDSDDEPQPAQQTRRLRAVLSDPFPPTPEGNDEDIPRLSLDEYSKEESAMWRAIQSYHRKIPKQMLISWLGNLRSVISEWKLGSDISAGSGCSGTDIWILCLEALVSFWDGEFGMPETHVRHAFSAEADNVKQKFLRSQFDMPVLVSDVSQFKEARVWNMMANRAEVLPWTVFFGGGFSCKGNSKQNSNRKANKGCVQRGDTSSGVTFEAMRQWIIKARPKITWLENVPELCQQVDQEIFTFASDAEYIRECFESHDFTVITVVINCRNYGPIQGFTWGSFIQLRYVCCCCTVGIRYHPDGAPEY